MKKTFSIAPRDWIGSVLVLAGFILRTRQYLANRSLWLDEAMISVNIIDRSFIELMHWLDYDQQAPIGFLWLQKVVVSVLGDNELVLRLVPFLAGCAALWLMFRFTRRFSPISGNTSLALFVVSSTLIYYTSESKQYILDVTVALSLVLLFLHLDRQGLRPRDHLLLGLVGAILIWFSHPAIFILAGLGVIILMNAVRKRCSQFQCWMFFTGGMWLGSFLGYYLVFLKRSINADVLLDYWGDAFLPLSERAGTWLIQSFNNYITFTLGLDIPSLVYVGISLLGLVILVYRNGRIAAALLLPVLFSLAASAFHAYPFAGRMLLFSAPASFVLLGEGVEAPIVFIRRNVAALPWISGLLAIFLVVVNAQTAAMNFIQPKYQEHIRPALEYLRDHRKPGDLIYIYHWAEPAIRFYAPKYKFVMSDFNIGVDHHDQPELYHAELDALRGQERVWFIFSHVYEQGSFNERDYILEYLDSIGRRSRQIDLPGTSVYLYLYDLGEPVP